MYASCLLSLGIFSQISFIFIYKIRNRFCLLMKPWAATKKCKIVWRCHQLLYGFLAIGPLSRVSRQSILSVYKDDEMIQRVLHRSLGFYLSPEESPRKPPIGERLIKAVRPVIASNGVPCI